MHHITHSVRSLYKLIERIKNPVKDMQDLNVQGLHEVLNMSEYGWNVPWQGSKYAWSTFCKV